MESKKMKINYLLFLSVFIVSCGEDGKDGSAYIAFDWSSAVSSYSDNNTSTPSIVYRNQNYQTSPGSYSCTWYAETSTSSVLWRGTYTITINKGAKGEFLTNGENGSDKYFKLYLSSSGYSFGKTDAENSGIPIKPFLQGNEDNRERIISKRETILSKPDTLFKENMMLIFKITERLEYTILK